MQFAQDVDAVDCSAIAALPLQERIDKVKPLWSTMSPEDRAAYLTVSVKELHRRATELDEDPLDPDGGYLGKLLLHSLVGACHAWMPEHQLRLTNMLEELTAQTHTLYTRHTCACTEVLQFCLGGSASSHAHYVQAHLIRKHCACRGRDHHDAAQHRPPLAARGRHRPQGENRHVEGVELAHDRRHVRHAV